MLHLPSDQVSGDSFHLQAKASRVKFQAVVAYDRGQDHLGVFQLQYNIEYRIIVIVWGLQGLTSAFWTLPLHTSHRVDSGTTLHENDDGDDRKVMVMMVTIEK